MPPPPPPPPFSSRGHGRGHGVTARSRPRRSPRPPRSPFPLPRGRSWPCPSHGDPGAVGAAWPWGAPGGGAPGSTTTPPGPAPAEPRCRCPGSPPASPVLTDPFFPPPAPAAPLGAWPRSPSSEARHKDTGRRRGPMAAASKGESRYPPPPVPPPRCPPSLSGCPRCRCLPAACTEQGGDTERLRHSQPCTPQTQPWGLFVLSSPRAPHPRGPLPPCPCRWHSPHPGGTVPGSLRRVLSSPAALLAALPVPWPRCQGQAARYLLARLPQCSQCCLLGDNGDPHGRTQ